MAVQGFARAGHVADAATVEALVARVLARRDVDPLLYGQLLPALAMLRHGSEVQWTTLQERVEAAEKVDIPPRAAVGCAWGLAAAGRGYHLGLLTGIEASERSKAAEPLDTEALR